MDRDNSNRRDGVVIRASALRSIDAGFIFQVESYQKSLKNDIQSFPTWRASLLVVSLGKTLNAIPPSLCGRQEVGPSNLVAPV